AGGGAEGGVRKDGRCQDRFEILLGFVLPEGGHGATEAGVGLAGDTAQDGQVDGDCLPGAAYSQRQRRGISRTGAMDKGESGRGCAVAFYAVSSRVFVEESSDYAGAHPGTRQGDCRCGG